MSATELENAYAAAWEEWDGSGEAELWDAVVGDELDEPLPVNP